MNRVRVALISLIVTGLLGAMVGVGTYSAFSSTTANGGNRFDAGTVYITDNDAGGAMLSLTNARPGNTASGCIRITYSGTLSSSVRIYGQTTGSLPPYLTLTVTRGTVGAAFPSCTGFTPGATVYNGSLGSFPTTYAAGVVDPGTWTSGTTNAYMFTVTLVNDPAAQGLTGTATFTWEARNL